MTPKFTARIENGKLVFDEPPEYHRYIAALAKKNRHVDVVVKHRFRQRSGNQNRYYHGVILRELANCVGETKEAMHVAMKRMFLSYENNGIVFIKSTADLATAEMEEYHEQIRRWSAEFLDLVIPDPNQVEY